MYAQRMVAAKNTTAKPEGGDGATYGNSSLLRLLVPGHQKVASLGKPGVMDDTCCLLHR